MKAPFERSLSDWIAIAEKKKRQEVWKKLRIPLHLRIDGFQFDCLAYHLTERSGEAHVKLTGDELKVGEPGQSTGLTYSGDAVDLVLHTWRISTDEAEQGIVIELQDGARV